MGAVGRRGCQPPGGRLHLRGVAAESERLYLARDHAGERPLYYKKNDDFFAFASMPKGLLALPGVSAALDENTLADFLAILPLADGKSFFGNLQPLPHGHTLTVTPDGIRLRQYWHPSNTRPLRLKMTQSIWRHFASALTRLFAVAFAPPALLGAN